VRRELASTFFSLGKVKTHPVEQRKRPAPTLLTS